MQIVNCEQGTQEWHDLRALRMGASDAQAVAANGKGLETLVREKVRKHFSFVEEPRYQSAAMEHGNEQEDIAATIYEFKTGTKTRKVGYVVHSEHVGVSPDRLAGEEGLVEIKCPENKAFFNLLLDRKVDTGYQWQMQMQMLVCKKSWCDHVVYNPNFSEEMIIIRFLPDLKKFDKLTAGIAAGEKRIKELLSMDIFKKEGE